MPKILCPICEEELANSEEQLPEKCPTCDTRKHQILQELRGEDSTTPFIIGNNLSAATTKEERRSEAEEDAPYVQVVVEEELPEDLTEPDTQPYISYPEMPVVSESSVMGVANYDNSTKADTDVIFDEGQDSDEQDVIFEEPHEMRAIEAEEFVEEDDIAEELFQTEDAIEEQVLDSILMSFPAQSDEIDAHSEIAGEELEEEQAQMDEQELSPQATPPRKNKKPLSSGPIRTGASVLEMLPNADKKFPPGHYLILYNSERKAIVHFRIDDAGSIIIGRSSERSSTKDIDLSLAWKQYYRRKTTDDRAFREKMEMLKGLSRKHALIRYKKEENSYVFFHLSEKNFSIIRLPNGEKRERAPGNRNVIVLESGSLISMGNQKNFMVLSFKRIS